MTSRRLSFCLMILAFVSVGCSRASHSASAAGPVDARVEADLDRLRAATLPFKNLDSAVAKGYPRDVPECLVHEHHGAMGYHHVNRSYLAPALTIERPQILLYERLPNGEYRLNGVEFIIPYRMYARDSVPPVLMGQQLHHEDNLNIWYLHVWAWTPNADGVFANFNAAVSCPGESGKVYKPFSRDAGTL